jgi:hypothetical protein
MHPYFQNLKKQLFSQEEKDFLRDFFSKNQTDFFQYQTEGGEHDGNMVHYSKSSVDLPPVKRVLKDMTLQPTVVVGLMHKPNIKVIRHRDENDLRRTVIICPLSPDPSLYAPTHFYELKEGVTKLTFVDAAIDTEWAATCNWEDGIPAIVNTKTFHDLVNNGSYRYNIQFCFKETFEEIVDLYNTGKLFADVTH